MSTVAILGVKISTNTPTEIEHYLLKQVDNTSSTPKIIFTPNPELLVLAHRDISFLTLLNSADLLLPDGQGIVWSSHGKIKQRTTGVDTMFFLLKLANNSNLSVGFVINIHGLSQENDILTAVKKRFPNVKVSVTSSTFPTATTPDIIFVGLGAPQQEYWVNQQRAALGRSKIILTVGGGIDFLTGQQQRAPLFFQKIGVEWLWRLWKQPQRLKRIFNATIIFPIYHLFYD